MLQDVQMLLLLKGGAVNTMHDTNGMGISFSHEPLTGETEKNIHSIKLGTGSKDDIPRTTWLKNGGSIFGALFQMSQSALLKESIGLVEKTIPSLMVLKTGIGEKWKKAQKRFVSPKNYICGSGKEENEPKILNILSIRALRSNTALPQINTTKCSKYKVAFVLFAEATKNRLIQGRRKYAGLRSIIVTLQERLEDYCAHAAIVALGRFGITRSFCGAQYNISMENK
jgi:hypothetical protein